MKICYIANPNSIHNQRWLNYFLQRGHEVHLISFYTRSHEKPDNRIHLHPLTRRPGGIFRFPVYFIWILQVRRLVKQIKPDILHSQYITENSYLGVASGFHPLILSAWGSDILITSKNKS